MGACGALHHASAVATIATVPWRIRTSRDERCVARTLWRPSQVARTRRGHGAAGAGDFATPLIRQGDGSLGANALVMRLYVAELFGQALDFVRQLIELHCGEQPSHLLCLCFQ